MQLPEQVKVAGDVVAFVGTVAVITKLVPVLAGVVTIIWTAIRIWETETVQKWIKRWRS